LQSADEIPDSTIPDITNLAFWYYPCVIEKLHRLQSRILKIENIDIRNFFLVCFSNCARKVSLADPKFSVPVKLKESSYPKNHKLHESIIKILKGLKDADVLSVFKNICIKNIRRMESIANLDKIDVPIYPDAKKLAIGRKKIKTSSVSLIITSPPYAGAQKYIRANSLSLGWLGYCDITPLAEIKRLSIGREDFKKSEFTELQKTDVKKADTFLELIHPLSPLRAHVAACYLIEMRQALREAYRVLKHDGYMILVVGNNQVCGYEFHTDDFLKEIAEEENFKTILCLSDDIKSRGLMTKRNKTAGMISSEIVLVLQK
jgi:hypothetical protein